MASFRFAPLALIFIFAICVMFAVHNTEAGSAIRCGERCLLGRCHRPGCTCIRRICRRNHVIAAEANTVDDHHLLCESHEDCFKKGSGNYCAFFPDTNIHYGWCFNAESEGYMLKDFLETSIKDNLEIPMAITN
uniref:Albumin 1 n=1 Tax=Clitoria ternatea TaxID=43366 RepID=A0A0S1RQI2_CLITE|nr:albumin 1 [Clitoria ternatea]